MRRVVPQILLFGLPTRPRPPVILPLITRMPLPPFPWGAMHTRGDRRASKLPLMRQASSQGRRPVAVHYVLSHSGRSGHTNVHRLCCIYLIAYCHVAYRWCCVSAGLTGQSILDRPHCDGVACTPEFMAPTPIIKNISKLRASAAVPKLRLHVTCIADRTAGHVHRECSIGITVACRAAWL